ncbi:MAG: nucleotide pyrophosphohydrolase [Planctomycetota bacterium]|nr:MAG: nucleotide pyrophosphohydrolase [Planctomycetota bacterium]
MPDDATTIDALKQLVDAFVSERDWHRFHTPKNLSMALSIEAAELMEHFQWLEPAEAQAVADDAERRAAVGEELADVVCYALALANALGIDVAEAMRDKMQKNVRKYPADQYRGRWGHGDRREGQ